jgi:hypothetical protein
MHISSFGGTFSQLELPSRIKLTRIDAVNRVGGQTLIDNTEIIYTTMTGSTGNPQLAFAQYYTKKAKDNNKSRK